MESLKTLSGRTIIAGFPDCELPPSLARAARDSGLGAFVLFRRNLPEPGQAVELTRQITECCGEALPALISIDQEGGRVARLGAPVLSLPPMGRLGRLNRPELTHKAATVLGQQLRALGFNLDFAPVLDVDSNPANPVIGDRSFGPTVSAVVRHARAFAAGLRASGVAACGKHFPGHGDTELDSHFELPSVKHPWQRLVERELVPFRELAPELPALMTAHVIFETLDARRPATLSPSVVGDILRRDWGYEGVVFSDDLEMKAISDHYGVPEAACQALRAGCDGVMVCHQPELVLETQAAIVRQAEASSDFRQRVEDAASRMQRLRHAHPVAADPRAFEQSMARARALEDHLEAAFQKLTDEA